MVTPIIHRLRGIIQLHLFLFGFRWEYVVGIAGFALGTLGSIIEPPVSIFGLSVAVISALLGLILFWKDTLEIRRAEKDLYEVRITSDRLKSLQKSSKYSGHKVINFHERYAIYSSEVNQLLGNKNLEFEFESKKFRMNQVARSIAPFVLRTAFKSERILFNSPKVRLKSDLTTTGMLSGSKVLLQQTDYFSSICTNEMICKEVWSRRANAQIFDGLSLMSNNRILLDLIESKCSNHIGISTLTFTNDGKMIVTVQSAESAQSAGLLAPSGSGSADIEDLEGVSTNFQDFITNAMARELIEECGLVDNIDGLVKTRLIGFSRLLNRGGKPEFFGVSFLNISFDALRITGKEAVFIANIMEIRVNQTNITEFKSALNRFQREHQGRFSFLLYIHLKFLMDYLESSPNFLLSLVTPQDP
ncbi:hypothetical protein ANRL3_02962 [Anaerolineae bacterium]|nr:hypothetical protein ANRL3_02962 [Anaerolineae bacterium]